MENNEIHNEVAEAGTIGGLRLIYAVVLFYILACVPGGIISADWDAFEKKVAQEYGLPLSITHDMIGRNVQHEFKFLPYPHDVWYITLENGSDVTVGTAYFSIVSLKESNIDTYFPLRELRRELGAHDFPFSSYQ